MKLYDTFLPEDLPFFEPDGKVGLLATVSDEGLPHMTLITAMRAPDTSRLVFGQFCEGLGKEYAERNRRTGFLIMTLDKVLWRGKGDWTAKAGTGPAHEVFNAKPMWRYNSYFGIHTVHYLDVKGTTRREKLPVGAIIAGVVKAALPGGKLRRRPDGTVPEPAMNDWTLRFISRTGNLKFLSYIGGDGYPVIIPCLSATAADPGTILIPGSEYKKEVATVPEGSPMCLFTMSLDMETVLVRGKFRRPGARPVLGRAGKPAGRTGAGNNPGRRGNSGAAGRLEVNWVYNSMPPVAKRIFPPDPANAKVTVF